MGYDEPAFVSGDAGSIQHRPATKRKRCMAHLSYPSPDEVQLRLDANEDAILTVLRHVSWWTRAAVEGQLPGSSLVAGVTLTAARGMDSTIRDILLRSFRISFPPDGGDGVQAEAKVAAKAQRQIR